MRTQKKDLYLYIMLLTTLIIPLIVGLYMQSYSEWRFVSIPLHSFMESAGAIVAFILSAIIFMMYQRVLEFNHFHRASFALLSMGVFDAFHAMVYPGELFVWLHSLAIFWGGILFCLVWVPDVKVSKKVYLYTPLGVFFISVVISVLSILFPSFVPQMLNEKKEFTDAANLLNMVGGVMYVVASFYFIKKYLDEEEFDDLLFAGHTMFFGSAGLLFFFSSLWDMQWWFWHTLRLFAYIVSLVFMLKLFSKNLKKLEMSNETILKKNNELNRSLILLKEYKNAIYQGSIISTADLSGNITYVNDELLKITGYTKDELIGRPHNVFRDPDTPKSVFKEMWQTIQNGETYKGLVKNKKKNGKSFYAKITIVPIVDENGKVFEYLALRDDVSELVKSQKELQKNFFTDNLTSLSNRFKLNEDLKENFKGDIALLNIDNFKSINDFYGQDFGDSVLKELSSKILEFTFKNNYELYRNHGDEFIVVSFVDNDINKFMDTINDFVKYVENTKLKIGNIDIDISLTTGIVKNTDDIVKADIALKEAKRLQKNIMVYDEDLNIHKIFESNILWSKKIKEALADDRIEIFLQPIYSNKENRVVKYESLIRLIEENGKVVSPYYFLEVAKRTKLYPQLTRRVIKKAFKVLNETNKEISINICADDIFDDETRTYLFNMLKSSKNTSRLVIELVESESIESFSNIKEFLDDIKKYGVKLAIDDFGTGYSNFEYLLKLEADYIKIDGSMIKNIHTDTNSFNVVETIVSFAKKNHMGVIAEYVASKEIQEKIIELEIDFSQGYYIDEPKLWDDIK